MALCKKKFARAGKLTLRSATLSMPSAAAKGLAITARASLASEVYLQVRLYVDIYKAMLLILAFLIFLQTQGEPAGLHKSLVLPHRDQRGTALWVPLPRGRGHHQQRQQRDGTRLFSAWARRKSLSKMRMQRGQRRRSATVLLKPHDFLGSARRQR